MTLPQSLEYGYKAKKDKTNYKDIEEGELNRRTFSLTSIPTL